MTKKILVIDMERGKKLGAKDYLIKARFTSTDLVIRVKEYL